MVRSGIKVTDKVFIESFPEEWKKDLIRKVVVDIRTYLDMNEMKELGMVFDYKEFSFSKVWLYGWIRGALTSGKNRV